MISYRHRYIIVIYHPEKMVLKPSISDSSGNSMLGNLRVFY